MKIRTVGTLLGSALLASITYAQDYPYYEWPDPEFSVTVDTGPDAESPTAEDLWPISNLIQGPGVGFDENVPNNQPGGGSDTRWVTAADAGFPADYIEAVKQPVIQFDLGEDRVLKEISVWGYSGGNSNGTSQFSLRFAADAEGGDDGIFGEVDYGSSIAYNPTFELFSDPAPQQYKLFDEVVTARYVEFTNLDNFFIPPGTNDGPEPGQEIEERLLPYLPGGDRVGLGEVAFMILPDDFMPGDKLPSEIAGPDFGTLTVSSSVTSTTISELGPQPGLAQLWYNGYVSDPATYLDDLVDGGTDANPLLNPDGNPIATAGTWWDGAGTLTANGVKLQDYPAELVGTKLDGSTNSDQYSVKLTGEIFIPEDGTFVFRDTVDDFTMLAIDLAGDGELDFLNDLIADDLNLGGELEDVLILDDAWAAVDGGNSNDNAFAEFENIDDGGEWRTIEMWIGEGGGGDSGTLFVANADDPDIWDTEVAEVLTQDQIDKFLITDDMLRTDSAVMLISASSESDPIPNNEVFEYQLQVGSEGNDQIAATDLSVGDGTSTLSVAGTTIRIAVEDEIAEGTEFLIFSADEVTGLDTLTLLFDDESLWDISRLDEGILVFGLSGCDPNTMGDIDGNGTVDFTDFLILSTNFSTMVDSHELGDIDCSGTVDFTDFLVLSTNFGMDFAATAVPEPSTFGLAAISGMLLGLMRQRRRR